MAFFLPQVNVSDGGSCTIQGREYRLLQWHFHAPSEHAFGGNRDAMELHIVHKEVNTGMTSSSYLRVLQYDFESVESQHVG